MRERVCKTVVIKLGVRELKKVKKSDKSDLRKY